MVSAWEANGIIFVISLYSITEFSKGLKHAMKNAIENDMNSICKEMFWLKLFLKDDRTLE